MVAFVPGLSNRVISPGSPAPITFGMNTANDWMNNRSESLSLNPGIGNPGSGRDGFLGGYSGGPGGAGGGGGGGAASPSSPPIAASGQPQSAQNFAPVNVQALAPPSFGLSALGSIYSDSPTSASVSPDPGGVSVKNLAPTNVQAQMPVKPGLFGSYNQWYNDHRFLGGMAEGLASAAIPMLKPVLVAAHAYYRSQHGQPLFGPLWGRIANAFSGSGDGPGSPLSNSPNSPLFASLYDARGSGSGADPNAPGGGLFGAPTIASSGALPAYPGLSGLSGGSAPLGGFWNQQALRDAAPVYGPYAAFGHGTPSSLPAGAPFAPAGILGA